MPRGTEFSNTEQIQIKSFREAGMKISEIASRLNRHRNSISNFCKNCDQYGKTKRKGAKPKVSARDLRKIKELAVQKSMSANDIRCQLSLNITRRRVQQILSTDPNLVYRKRLPKPKLTIKHMHARLLYAEKHQFWNEEWKSVIFSDEKKWNMDGPDGIDKKWDDKRLPRSCRHHRNFGGGTIMTWAAFSYFGKTPMCFISLKMNSENYTELLGSELVQFGENIHGDSWIFQQDNAPIHTSTHTKNFLSSSNIPIMEWPAVSPDLNPMENLWGILTKNIYKSGRQFNHLRELKEAINAEWAKIDAQTLKNLVDSMPGRLNEVVSRRGGHINY